ncbi:MAG: response regulator [Acidobacteriota bacterium]|nr:response regulator [Blastocatellia bacterium]MDW8412164.1 response regulator [Acidobacteriota bacterium]
MRVYASVADLIFASKITGTAQKLGVEVHFYRDLDDLLASAEQLRPDLFILDLDSSKLDSLEVIRSLKAKPQLRQVPIVAFLSHVRTDLKKEAELAGCDRVLARSQFNARIVEILTGKL